MDMQLKELGRKKFIEAWSLEFEPVERKNTQNTDNTNNQRRTTTLHSNPGERGENRPLPPRNIKKDDNTSLWNRIFNR